MLFQTRLASLCPFHYHLIGFYLSGQFGGGTRSNDCRRGPMVLLHQRFSVSTHYSSTRLLRYGARVYLMAETMQSVVLFVYWNVWVSLLRGRRKGDCLV